MSRSPARAAGAILRHAPTPDALINNAATWLERCDGPYDAAEVASVVASAVTGTFLLTQALLPALERSPRPDVATIGSITGLPNARLSNAAVPFQAANHGQAGLIDGLRQMFVGTRVRSIGVHPPGIEDVSPLEPAWGVVPALDRALWIGLVNKA